MLRTFFAVSCLLIVARPIPAQSLVSTFENLAYPPNPNNPSQTLPYNNGVNLPGSFTSGGATFNNSYSLVDFGGFPVELWSGWAYSSVTNTTTPGFGNQYAAYALSTGGAGAPLNLGDPPSTSYAVAFGSSVGDSIINLPTGYRPDSIQITNTTYAALIMKDGDPGFGLQKFGHDDGLNPDFFLLKIHGFNAAGQSTGTIDFYLADYRFENSEQDYIISDWTTVDLSSLGIDTSWLTFSLTSSDNDPVFGMNTPGYFAVDNLVMTAVPEPATVGLAGALGLLGWRTIRRRFRV